MREREKFIGVLVGSLKVVVSQNRSKRQKMSNSPKTHSSFPDVEKVALLELLSRAKPGFAVSASSRRARRRERRFLWGVPFPVARGEFEQAGSRSIVVVVVVVHIRGSLVMSRARVIARETDAAFLVSGMLFPFSMSRALSRARARLEARGVCASFPSSLIFPFFFSPKKTPTERYSTKNKSKNVQTEPAHVNRRFHILWELPPP